MVRHKLMLVVVALHPVFNIILQDGTRSDNAMTVNGEVYNRYDYFLPQNNKITAVTIY